MQGLAMNGITHHPLREAPEITKRGFREVRKNYTSGFCNLQHNPPPASL